MGGYGDNYPATVTLEGNVSLHDTGYADSIIVYMTDIGTPVVHRRYYINQRQALETRTAPFRGWTGGAGREAGSWQGDAIRNVTGSAGIGGQTGIAYPLAMDGNTGALCPQGEKGTHSLSTMTSVNTYGGLVFDASHAVPTAAENRPVNIAVPVILYLGLSA